MYPKFAEVSFDTFKGNHLSYLQNGYFSKKKLWCFHDPINQVDKQILNEAFFSLMSRSFGLGQTNWADKL